MFYRRIFSMNWMIWTCLIISCCWCAGSMVAALSAPKPVSYFWNEVTDPSSGRYRYDFYYYYIGNATANMVTDVLILTAPLPIVWKLQMRIGQKIEVCSLFLLGGLYRSFPLVKRSLLMSIVCVSPVSSAFITLPSSTTIWTLHGH